MTDQDIFALRIIAEYAPAFVDEAVRLRRDLGHGCTIREWVGPPRPELVVRVWLNAGHDPQTLAAYDKAIMPHLVAADWGGNIAAAYLHEAREGLKELLAQEVDRAFAASAGLAPEKEQR